MSAVKKSERKQDRHGISNIEARSLNHCCYGNAVYVTYSECVVVALVFRIVICGQSGSTIFLNIMS